jgi:hypothetical protein
MCDTRGTGMTDDESCWDQKESVPIGTRIRRGLHNTFDMCTPGPGVDTLTQRHLTAFCSRPSGRIAPVYARPARAPAHFVYHEGVNMPESESTLRRLADGQDTACTNCAATVATSCSTSAPAACHRRAPTCGVDIGYELGVVEDWLTG